jgi:recombination protein RecT
MTAENLPAKIDETPLGKIKRFARDPDVKRRLSEMLGKRAGAFANSIINLVKGNKYLQDCTPDSIMASAMQAASMNLPIDPALGYAAIVPYKNTAQFQIMYKGLTQLCIRSGQYETLNCVEIYNDELQGHNPITGDVHFKDPANYKLRYEVNAEGLIDPKNVCGVYACFELKSGFKCQMYMSKEEVVAHGKRFSKAYQYDLREKKRASMWSIDPVTMWKKTVLKRLLSKYGIMSIEMQEAIVQETADFEDTAQEAAKQIEGETGTQVQDAQFEGDAQSASPAADDWRNDIKLPGEPGYVAPAEAKK